MGVGFGRDIRLGRTNPKSTCTLLFVILSYSQVRYIYKKENPRRFYSVCQYDQRFWAFKWPLFHIQLHLHNFVKSDQEDKVLLTQT